MCRSPCGCGDLGGGGRSHAASGGWGGSSQSVALVYGYSHWAVHQERHIKSPHTLPERRHRIGPFRPVTFRPHPEWVVKSAPVIEEIWPRSITIPTNNP